jgi:hypothetical protein
LGWLDEGIRLNLIEGYDHVHEVADRRMTKNALHCT